MNATARTQRVHQRQRGRKEMEVRGCNRRVLVDPCAPAGDARTGCSAAPRPRPSAGAFWSSTPDGSGRLHVLRSKTGQTAEGSGALPAIPRAVDTLLAIRPEEAVIDPGASVFGLSASQIYRRVRAATKMAGLGEGFSAHSPRVGMAQNRSAAGAELPELMTVGRWDSPTMPAKYTDAHAAGKRAVRPGITGATSRSDSPQYLVRSSTAV